MSLISVVDTANSLLGKVKYSFGATDVANGKGDCSSFTQYVFKQNGISIGRTTNEQYQQGTSVNKEDLQPGDLVFFKNTYNSGYKDGVSHVGIYVGNGQFIHNSSGKGGTTVSNLSDNYYSKHYLGARRVDGSASSAINTSVTNTGTGGTISKIGAGIAKGLVVIVLIVLVFLFFVQGFGLKIGRS